MPSINDQLVLTEKQRANFVFVIQKSLKVLFSFEKCTVSCVGVFYP